MTKLILAAPLFALALTACKEGVSDATTKDAPEVQYELKSAPPPPALPPIQAKLFNTKAISISPDYSGHICSQLVAALENKPINKDKYESTKEYTARMLEFGKTPYLDELKLGDQLAFSVTEKNLVFYDADKGLLTVRPLFTEYNSSFGSGAAMLPSQVLSSVEDTYIGSNSFGVQKNVNVSKKKVCAVTLANVQYIDMDDKFTFKKKLQPSVARILEGNISTLYIGTLMPPYISSYSKHDRPEINNPYEKQIEGKTLLIKAQQVWLVNKKTGEVLAKNIVK